MAFDQFRIFLFLGLISLTFACTPKLQVVQAYQIEDKDNVSSDSIDSDDLKLSITSRYAGDALDFIVFEMDIENLSEDSIYLSSSDIVLSLFDNNRDIKLNPLDKDQFIFNLQNEYQAVERQKKNTMIGNIVLTTLNVFGIALGGGGLANVIISGAEGAIITADDNQYYNWLEGSIEEQMAYLEDWVFDDFWIEPGEHYSKDLLFDRYLFQGDATLVFNSMQDEYIFKYEIVLSEQ